MLKLEFSVLSYHPSFITDESINLGILFHCTSNDKRLFKHTKNWKRLEAFDDEVNLDFVKIFLQGIKDGIEENLFNGFDFDLESYTRFYVNEFKFSKIHCVEVKNIDEFINTTNRIYLKYDFDKKERLNRKQELKYLKVLLKSKDVDYSRDGVIGVYNDNVKYDYIIGEYGVKLFELDEKNVHFFVNQAKLWTFNANEFKNQYKTIIAFTQKTDSDLKENKYFKTIEKIIENSEVHRFLEFDDCIKFLNVV